jgi:mono/diheme cytochrome c family protein
MRLLKWTAISLLVLLVVLSIAISFTVGWRPFIGPKIRAVTGRHFDATPARLERGRYLATSVSGCIECHTAHSPADFKLMTGKPGSGQIFLDQRREDNGMLVVAENITPDKETGIGSWTDDEIARAIREGVDRTGRTLFPIMPYSHFHSMSDEDLASVVVYIRSLEPVKNALPATAIPFPVSRLINSSPEPVTAPVTSPVFKTPVERGEYLTNIGGCSDCHTPVDDHHMPRHDLEFAGGMTLPGEQYAAANITPDPTGISYYDDALFLDAMRTGKVRARELRKPMPWWVYRGMSDEDLKAIFAFLRTVKPVQHRVDNAEPPTLCRVCRLKHGLGEKN